MKRINALLIALLAMIHVQGQDKVLHLKDCRQLALDHNQELQIAEKTLRAAYQLKQSAFKQFLPTITSNAVYTWNEKNVSLLDEDAMLPVGAKMSDGSFGFRPDQVSNNWTQINGQSVPLDAGNKPFDPKVNPEKLLWKNYAFLPKESMEFDIKNIFVGGVNIVQPIYLGGKIRELYKLSKYNETIATVQKEDKLTELLLEVDEAYWRVISLENKVALAKEYKKLVSKADSNLLIMIEEGVATRADELRLRVKLNETDISLAKAENGLVLSRMALNQLCGLPLDDKMPLSDEDLTSTNISPEQISTESAMQNRTEIRMLTQAQNIAKSNQRLMFSRFLPTLAATANYVVSNPNMYNGYEKKFAGMFNVGVVLNVPVCHFGDKFHTYKAAKIGREIAELKLQDAKDKITLQINQCFFQMNESLKKQIATENNIHAAEENLRIATEGFGEGIITSTDLMGAQNAWLTAKSENIDAVIDVRLHNLYLQKALGTLITSEK